MTPEAPLWWVKHCHSVVQILADLATQSRLIEARYSKMYARALKEEDADFAYRIAQEMRRNIDKLQETANWYGRMIPPHTILRRGIMERVDVDSTWSH